MGLRKGTTNNPNGRPKGSVNKVAEEVRESFQKLLKKNISTLQKDLLQLSPKDRISAMLKLAEYVLPRLKSLDDQSTFTYHEYAEYLEMKAKQDRFKSMTREELDAELDRLERSSGRHNRHKNQ